MKRTISVIMAVLMIVLAITSCSGSSSAAGKYYIKSIDGQNINDYFNAELGDMGFTLEELLQIVGIPSVEEYMTVELNSDGTAVIKAGGEDPSNGTWTQSGDKVTITIDGEAAVFTLKGNELTFVDESGSEFILIKK